MQANRFNIDQVRSFWDRIASEYDRINDNMDWTHVERFETLQAFLPKTRSATVLNVWSRTGSAVPYIRELIPEAQIDNFEASAEMIKIAQKRFPDEDFTQTDLHDFRCETESKDVVVSLETLEHTPDPLHFLLECHRVLKVGGRLVLSCPPAWAEWPLRLYETFFENHGEGPHRFPRVGAVLRALRHCDFEIVEHRGTVLLPVGPEWLKRKVELAQSRLLRHLGTNRLGIRHFFVAEKTRSRDPVWARLHEEIIRPGLSMQSGTCIGLSQGTLELDEPDGRCLPKPTGRGPVPEICYDASPEVRPDYPTMTEIVFGHSEPRSRFFGEYRRLAIAHHKNPDIRSQGASGSMLTGLLLHLLETHQITGAVVLKMSRKQPWRAIPVIARTEDEILAAAQSKYVTSPVNTILSALEDEAGPLAYIGLPHQVFAIRRLQHMNHASVKAIKYVFGPFFGNELGGASVDAFLRKFQAQKNDVLSLSYRGGEWPGYLQAQLRDGRTARLPKFHANYLIPFYITPSSLLSHDLTNEFTDVSGGDAWAPAYEKRGQGFSLAIVRTAQGEHIVREMEAAGKLELLDISEDEATKMQSHGLDLKKRGTFLRLRRIERRGQRVHDYGLPVPHSTWQRRVFESSLGVAFAFCRSSPGRFLADLTPHSVIGPLFQWFRKVWKFSTRNVKRIR